MAKKYFKHRGVEGLVYARVLTDTNEPDGYTFGEVKPLAPVARIGKSTEADSATEYYDNIAYFVMSSEGPDEFEMDTTAFDLETEAELTGRGYDPETGMMVEGQREDRYFAIGYKTKGNDGGYRYVWRYKVKFSLIEEEHNTENEGTDTTGPTLKCTGIPTVHKFTKGHYDSVAKKWIEGPAKGIVIDSRDDLADLTNFFKTVTTPDDVQKKTA